ncbi:hypothetical protein CFE70_000695 [Pyrenophora teres f. teres 0-1]
MQATTRPSLAVEGLGGKVRSQRDALLPGSTHVQEAKCRLETHGRPKQEVPLHKIPAHNTDGTVTLNILPPSKRAIDSSGVSSDSSPNMTYNGHAADAAEQPW